MDSTRLAPARYLELLAADGTRLGDCAEGNLDLAVPSCPGWTVTDLVEHTGSVFNHKVACIELGVRPEEGAWSPAPEPDQGLLDWYRASLQHLIDVLAERGPDYSTYSWYPPEQSTGFWYRRMAQEAVIHRVDAELAINAVTPADDALAVDGIDEVLEVFLRYGLGSDPEEDTAPFDGRSVLLREGGRAWHVSGNAGPHEEQIVLRREAAPADLVITGEPSELLLWLWTRRPDSAVRMSGSGDDVLPAFRALMRRATE